ncbi:MAG TPA: methylmalonyl-CoA mutase family protein, partial [Dehalococcoidales bacterium]|nr:methylmalonyl-CoA mutase family protein [Dehalococcoidales bacterium]
DSDAPLAKGEVGRVGVAVDSLKDMEVMFDGIPLDQISTSMTVNATSNVILAMYIAVAKKQGVSPALLQGTTQNDVLKEYIARGTYAFPAKPSMRLIADSAAYCSKNMPKWNYINIAGYHMREAGATAAQEIGFTMADAIEYVRTFQKAGLEVDSFAPRISWIFEVNNNFLEEVAKFRALRRIWARIMREKFGAKDPRSWTFRTHIQTGGVTLTAQQPRNNTIRATIQALAAVLGGVQSMAVSCYDEAIGLPTEESQLTSLRVQQIIASESGVVDTVDPLGGSYYLEYLTNKLEAEANAYIDKIEKMGGAATAIEQGYQQQEITTAAYRYQKQIEEQKIVIVGVNKFQQPSPKIERTEIDAKVEPAQIATLTELRKSRDNKAVQKNLAHLKEACKTTENTMPVLLECVESYATLGEICDTMRGVFGTQNASVSY